jgi:hypothetical protein
VATWHNYWVRGAHPFSPIEIDVSLMPRGHECLVTLENQEQAREQTPETAGSTSIAKATQVEQANASQPSKPGRALVSRNSSIP